MIKSYYTIPHELYGPDGLENMALYIITQHYPMCLPTGVIPSSQKIDLTPDQLSELTWGVKNGERLTHFFKTRSEAEAEVGETVRIMFSWA